MVLPVADTLEVSIGTGNFVIANISYVGVDAETGTGIFISRIEPSTQFDSTRFS